MEQIRHLIVGETEPQGSADWDNFAWFDTAHRRLCVHEGGAWVPAIDFAQFGDVNFTGTVSSGGTNGVDGKLVIGKKRLVFRAGICIGLEDVKDDVLEEA